MSSLPTPTYSHTLTRLTRTRTGWQLYSNRSKSRKTTHMNPQRVAEKILISSAQKRLENRNSSDNDRNEATTSVRRIYLI